MTDRFMAFVPGKAPEGPLEVAELERRLNVGLLPETTTVCRVGGDAWIPIRSVITAHAVETAKPPLTELPPLLPAPAQPAQQDLRPAAPRDLKRVAIAVVKVTATLVALAGVSLGIYLLIRNPAGEHYARCLEFAKRREWLEASSQCSLGSELPGRSAKPSKEWLEKHDRDVKRATLEQERKQAARWKTDVARLITLAGTHEEEGTLDSVKRFRDQQAARGFELTWVAYDAIENGRATFKGRDLPAGIARITYTLKNRSAGEVEYPCRYVGAIHDQPFQFWREIISMPCGPSSANDLTTWRKQNNFSAQPNVSWTTVADSLVAPDSSNASSFDKPLELTARPATSVAQDTKAPQPSGMVTIPAGEFTMGDDADSKAKPARRVTVTKPFFIDVTEVTVSAYTKCLDANACTPTSIHGPDVTSSEVEKFEAKCNAQYPERADHPVNCADRSQAAAYCAFVGKRLPTEAEWEYAARGSDGRTHPWGNETPGCDKAVVSGCGRILPDRASTKPVGFYASWKSPFGALDMAGNVFEWVADDWGSYDAKQSTDPVVGGAGTTGVIRGGSWDFGAAQLKAFARWRFYAANGHVSTGFRCARSAQP